MSCMRRLVLIALLMLPSLSACDSTGPARTLPDADALPRLRLEETIRLGDFDDPDQGFSQIGGVRIDRDGYVYVLERSDRQVRVYDEAGALVRRIGRRGSGPGEMESALSFGVVGDTVWVYDSRLRRITLFDRLGALAATVPVTDVIIATDHPSVSVRFRANGLRRDGRLSTSSTMRFSGERPVGVNVRLPVVSLELDGRTVADTIGWRDEIIDAVQNPPTVKVGDVYYLKPSAPNDGPLRTELEDGLVVTDRYRALADSTSTFAVARISADGDTVYQRMIAYRPDGYGEALIDAMVASAARMQLFGNPAAGEFAVMAIGSGDADQSADEEVERALRAELELPPFQAPILDQRVGEDGSVWLLRSDDDGPYHRWILLDTAGAPRGELSVPRHLALYWLDLGQVWAVERDEYDVPWLVRYRIVAE